MDDGEIHLLTGMELGGVIAMTIFSIISFTCVLLLLLHNFSIIVAPLLTKEQTDEERGFFSLHLSFFINSLLISDLCQAIAGLIQGRWAVSQVVESGTVCSAQAVLLQFGDVSAALWNTIIAIHTFRNACLGERMTKISTIILAIVAWSVAAVLTLIGPFFLVDPGEGPFYGVSLQWCFIREHYRVHRILVHYLPMLLCALAILILYSMVFLTLRGFLVIEGRSFRWVRSNPQNPFRKNTTLQSIAKKVLWYPIVYITLVLPVSVCRLTSLKPNSPPVAQAAFFASMCLLLSMGSANSIIYMCTRRIGPNPWFSRPNPVKGPPVQIFVSHITLNDVEDSMVDLPSGKVTHSWVEEVA